MSVLLCILMLAVLSYIVAVLVLGESPGQIGFVGTWCLIMLINVIVVGAHRSTPGT